MEEEDEEVEVVKCDGGTARLLWCVDSADKDCKMEGGGGIQTLC